MSYVLLAPEAIDAIARRTVEILRNQPADSDPWLTREQAEAYLNFCRTAFYFARKEFPEELKPCSLRPLRWSRNALDAFKLSRGVPLRNRPGRKRSQAFQADALA